MSFPDNSYLASCLWASGPLVVSCFSRIGEEDSSLADIKSPNESMLILSDLELPALPCIAPITAVSGCQNIDYIMCMILSSGLVGR